MLFSIWFVNKNHEKNLVYPAHNILVHSAVAFIDTAEIQTWVAEVDEIHFFTIDLQHHLVSL